MATDDSSEECSPSFFKVVRYPSAPHLALPTSFVKRYLEKIPKNPILKTAKGEYSWNLKFKKIGEDYCFSNGWEKLAKDARLCIMDIVVVLLIDASTFEISFFDANGCEKDLPLNNTNFSGDADDKVMLDEEDDDEEEVMADEKDEVTADEEDEVVADEEDEDGDEVNLCFQKVINEKSHRYIMGLPKKFVKAAELENKTGITMKDHEGKEWIMGLMAEKQHNRRSLSSGWSLFRQYYDLSEGDICLFKFNKEEGVLILAQVLRNRRGVRKEEIGKETPRRNVEGVKRKRGRPRLEKPRNGDGGVKVKIENKSIPEVEVEVVKRKRGRPPLQKHGDGGGGGVKIEDESVEVVKRKRGRPRVEKHSDGGGGGGKIEEDGCGAEVKRKMERPRLVEKDDGVKIKIEDGDGDGDGDGSVVKRKTPAVVGGGGGGVVEVKTEAETEVEEVVVKRKRGRPRLDKSRIVIYF